MTSTYIQARPIKRDRRLDRFLGRVTPPVADWLVRTLHAIAGGRVAVYPSTLHDHLYFADLSGYTIRMSLNVERGVLVILDIAAGGD